MLKGFNRDKAATVLLIDDEEPLLSVLEAALADEGYHCKLATSGKKALNLIERSPQIDIIVSDIRMPDINGIELLEVIRNRFGARTWLQVILMTGHATLDNSIAALRLQAVDFLFKPIRRPQLLAAVANAATKASEHRKMADGWSQGKERLERLTHEARQLGQMLTTMQVTDFSARTVSPVSDETEAHIDLTKERMLELLRTRDIKTRYFKEKLFVDPAWHMLSDLMENYLLDHQVSVTALYIASGIAAATAARRLEELEQGGFIGRTLDPSDGRRQLAHLTQKSIDLMMTYLTALHCQTGS
ncbi:response regulator [Ochrobactrum quorumnocens]|uniref:Response regulator n=1 Tax=Ochrobactrum quorumnocens TaxID=271865 RepID=A0A5N1JC45_9HYPH|nr:response regulator [[Ochrobactrum] quorumnocens]KAA9352673.1 response regulator [[Ochrobactrum] quorumnocens]